MSQLYVVAMAIADLSRVQMGLLRTSVAGRWVRHFSFRNTHPTDHRLENGSQEENRDPRDLWYRSSGSGSFHTFPSLCRDRE